MNSNLVRIMVFVIIRSIIIFEPGEIFFISKPGEILKKTVEKCLT
jgi:hypothetical protein